MTVSLYRDYTKNYDNYYLIVSIKDTTRELFTSWLNHKDFLVTYVLYVKFYKLIFAMVAWKGLCQDSLRNFIREEHRDRPLSNSAESRSQSFPQLVNDLFSRSAQVTHARVLGGVRWVCEFRDRSRTGSGWEFVP